MLYCFHMFGTTITHRARPCVAETSGFMKFSATRLYVVICKLLHWPGKLSAHITYIIEA
jgi:hypothetical protein